MGGIAWARGWVACGGRVEYRVKSGLTIGRWYPGHVDLTIFQGNYTDTQMDALYEWRVGANN